MSEAVYLALLSILSAAVAKLWVDVTRLYGKLARCQVEHATDRGKIEVLEVKIDSLERVAIHSKVSLSDALVTANGLGVITGWSLGAEMLFGWAAEEAVGKTILELMVPIESRGMHIAGFEHLMKSAKTAVTHFIPNMRVLKKNGVFTSDISVQGLKIVDDWVLHAKFIPRNEGQ